MVFLGWPRKPYLETLPGSTLVNVFSLSLPVLSCLRNYLVARATSLASQHSLVGLGIPRHWLQAKPALAAWSLWPGWVCQPYSGLEDDLVFPWKPPRLSGNHLASITSFQGP